MPGISSGSNESTAPEELAQRIARGDRRAEQELVALFSRGLMIMLRQRTKDPQLAEDIHQDAFCKVLKRLREDPLEDPTKVAAYLHQTAVYLCLGEIRKNVRRKTSADSERVSVQVDERASQFAEIAREETSTAVREVIEALPVQRDREVLHRFYLMEQEKSVICSALRLTERHFDRVIHRARQRFRDRISSKMNDITLSGVGP